MSSDPNQPGPFYNPPAGPAYPPAAAPSQPGYPGAPSGYPQAYPGQQQYPAQQTYPQQQPYPQQGFPPPQQGYPPQGYAQQAPQQGYPQQAPQPWYPAPGYQGGFPPPQSAGPAPRRPISPWLKFGLPAVALVLVAAVLFFSLGGGRLLGWGGQPTPTPPTSGPTVSTTANGQPNQAVTFATSTGSGTLTVTGTRWETSGTAAPAAGNAFLIVDLTVAVTQGQVSTGWMYARVLEENGTVHVFSVGPKVDSVWHSAVTASGQSSKGQLGFELPRSACTFQLLDDALRPVASIAIPA